MAEDYGEACRLALETSEPPRKVSRQAFGLFPKIRALDALMTPDLETGSSRAIPNSPSAIERRRADEPAQKGEECRASAGLDERRALLVRHGYSPAFLERLPRGAGMDDLLDAAVLALVARRIASAKRSASRPCRTAMDADCAWRSSPEPFTA